MRMARDRFGAYVACLPYVGRTWVSAVHAVRPPCVPAAVGGWRAGLPVASDKSPFHSRPLVAVAQPLPLGATSSAEVLELYLAQRVEPREARDKLQAQLPPGMVLAEQVEECEMYKPDGTRSETMAALTRSVEWHVIVQQVEPRAAGANASGGAALEAADWPPVDFTAAVAGVRGMERYVVKRRTVKKQRLVSEDKEDNNVLPPERVVEMMAAASGASLALVHAHRSRIALAAPAAAAVGETQAQVLRSLLRWEGHVAAKRQFGLGPWAGGLERRGVRDDTTVLV
ncbi:hypothetical protein GPECTOR_5g446 [Gonium pectorale]|uniref:DUF2344 domain-containing protein n=1 Tax=Gonium pectorale TaxID=33097 RepID=A0A150GWU3_GONPE|nr:hypothetical protein GPECTOR_5g446 [Gonium pectorale]|eukprot:KXZ54366.1 hypothetical protein GPECTOR_5g446 [Gonium pectorale]